MLNDDTDLESADTLRFTRVDLDATSDAALHPDATGIYDIRSMPPARYVGRSARSSDGRRRLARATRQDVARLREAIAEGWDVGPELAHEERRLAALEARK